MVTCNSTLELLPSQSWNVCFGVIIGFLSTMATFENGFVLMIFYWYQIFHTNSNKILASLAISDFLTGTIVGLLFTIQLLSNTLMKNCAIDMIRRYLSTAFIGASVFILGFISYDRSLHLTQLSSYKLTNRKLYIVLILCWLIPFLIPLLRKINDSEQVYSAVIAILGILVFLMIIISYVMIIRALYHHKSKSSVQLQTVVVRAERKAAKTVVILISCFTICILPILVHHTINVIKIANEETLAKSYVIAMTLCIVNSALNPVVYFYRTPHLKSHILRLIKCSFVEGISSERDASNDHGKDSEVAFIE